MTYGIQQGTNRTLWASITRWTSYIQQELGFTPWYSPNTLKLCGNHVKSWFFIHTWSAQQFQHKSHSNSISHQWVDGIRAKQHQNRPSIGWDTKDPKSAHTTPLCNQFQQRDSSNSTTNQLHTTNKVPIGPYWRVLQDRQPESNFNFTSHHDVDQKP